MIDCTLNQNGYPTNPRSIFIGIRRQCLPNIEVFRDCLYGRSKGYIEIAKKGFLGRWETLCGRVASIHEFSDGAVIQFPQDLKRSPLKWPDAILWIPDEGAAGILNPQYRDEMQILDSTTLTQIIDDLFRDRETLPFKINRKDVYDMTQYQQINFLRRISTSSRTIREGFGDLTRIVEFLQTVNQEGFRTAEDFPQR